MPKYIQPISITPVSIQPHSITHHCIWIYRSTLTTYHSSFNVLEYIQWYVWPQWWQAFREIHTCLNSLRVLSISFSAPKPFQSHLSVSKYIRRNANSCDYIHIYIHKYTQRAYSNVCIYIYEYAHVWACVGSSRRSYIHPKWSWTFASP